MRASEAMSNRPSHATAATIGTVHPAARRLVAGFISALLALAAPAVAQQHAGQYELADIEYGAELYAGRCINCHGESGDLMPGANLRRGQYRNATSDRELTAVIANGLPNTAMVPNGYSDSELTALVAYLRNMSTFDPSSSLKGDPDRGRSLYEGRGECGNCHRINGRGPRAAPDLSNVGATRTAALLKRTLTDPEAALLPVNRPVRAVLRDGTVLNGRRLNEDTFTVQIVGEDERLYSLSRADLREYTVDTKSRMPAYGDTFNEQELADLAAYLLTLKGL
jgi:putative heme-binding domain-containing protein